MIPSLFSVLLNREREEFFESVRTEHQTHRDEEYYQPAILVSASVCYTSVPQSVSLLLSSQDGDKEDEVRKRKP